MLRGKRRGGVCLQLVYFGQYVTNPGVIKNFYVAVAVTWLLREHDTTSIHSPNVFRDVSRSVHMN